MAATDKNYRDQYLLDMVFALTSILMLVSLVWMFVQDYNREFKDEQRSFRDVEAALAQRQALDQMPNSKQFDDAQNAVEQARTYRNDKDLEKVIEDLRAEAGQENAPPDIQERLRAAEARLAINKKFPKAQARIAELLPKKESSEQAYQAVKAGLDSISSFYDIEVDEHGKSHKADEYFDRIQALRKKVTDAQAAKDEIMAELKDMQVKTDQYEAPLTAAISNWKKVTDKFDAQVKLAISKQWTIWDSVRAFPVIDGFQSPLKIHQFTINDIPIDYNFKYVTRFDRCMTCHQGIDRPAFAKSKLKELTRVSSDYDQKLADAHDIMKSRRSSLKGLPDAKALPSWNKLQLTKVSKSDLTEARVNEYCAHPRLDLFVGANSKHPAEKFGCTSCHSGQGSATSFTLASHTPNNSAEKKRWEREHDWESIHMWDFPMQPMRFVEATCLKCHHQVTDLIGSDNRNEAPKLVRGFNLIKENGCFGCHEIAGRKAGRQIGPDLRLEPTPPLDSLTPNERAKIEDDVDNAPGNLRKVGPSLYRVSEKTNRDWAAKWLRAPRGFRPDTKMPHFYGLSNNHPDVLPESQKKFPDTEIWALANYLFGSSDDYLKQLAARHKDDAAVKAKDLLTLSELQGLSTLTEPQKKELEDVNRRIIMRTTQLLVDRAPGHKGDPAKGRLLFSERGCLACHSHKATEAATGKSGDKDYGPALIGEAVFGPNLSQIVDKLGTKQGDKESARIWLTQWIIQPQVHSPRSRMPVTHLTPTEAADVAAWLLAQPPMEEGADWAKLTVADPSQEDLKNLAGVYLVRLLSRSDMERFLDKGELRSEVASDLPVEEKELAAKFVADNPERYDSLKHYLGKKAVSRLGCYACHDIPGFDHAKPIGVGLNDWGKKDPGRLAFEDIKNYVSHHYEIVPSLVDAEGNAVPVAEEKGSKVTKMPYEKFYADAIEHNHREGYLNQKILAPRSYDYNRLRAWDDRSRMPQFRFAKTRQQAQESAEDFEARKNKDEAEAREAVATFILGLVADPVPAASVNQPRGERMAEVKGRQILDKFNCGGCHLVRPGSFDFKITEDTLKNLENAHKVAEGRAKQAGDHYFGNHANWVGKAPAAPDQLTAAVARPRVQVDEDDKNIKSAEIRLTRALRFLDKDRKMKDIEAASVIRLAPRDMIYPPPQAWESSQALAAFLTDKGPYGGRFADLLVEYLVARDQGTKEPFFVRDGDGDSSKARAAVPPILLGQGERTQPEWLYQFLLNPQPVRKMTVLRMPKFNMSQDEARTLVDYFAAVERSENPGIGLKYPYETIPQQEALTDPFWLQKNAEYVAKLKAAKTKDATGKDISLYDQRLKEQTPAWQQIRKDLETKQAEAKTKMDTAKPRLDAAKKTEDAEKDPAKKTNLEAARKSEEGVFQAWEAEWTTLTEQVKKNTLAEQVETWENEQAYVTDAFRIVANKQLCMQCHQIGTAPNTNQIQGPPLYLAYQRLRPGWLERWIATPQRFLTYASSMPNNFPVDKVGQYQELFVGSPLEQIIGIRDVLMAYPRAAALPVNHYWALPLPGDAKTPDTKAGDKK